MEKRNWTETDKYVVCDRRDDCKDVFFIGDIHGELKKLHNAIESIRSHCSEQRVHWDSITIVFLGDYEDRGHTRDVIEYLINFQKSEPHQTHIHLLGNHTFMMANALGLISIPELFRNEENQMLPTVYHQSTPYKVAWDTTFRYPTEANLKKFISHLNGGKYLPHWIAGPYTTVGPPSSRIDSVRTSVDMMKVGEEDSLAEDGSKSDDTDPTDIDSDKRRSSDVSKDDEVEMIAVSH
ncbi:hypothetical protein ADUPG1_009924 [Aduncisulcus paluster]|uniref:Calcineurin-like phosphoesterase domain-containing protein n=1 Tax=Aduncisulcus paluster TaxID=2918883 RepID=A0ABQ5KYG5_9EUKA|nr:hypothetical protein ADUPG1_009924 [Aduncisulcus paluster]